MVGPTGPLLLKAPSDGERQQGTFRRREVRAFAGGGATGAAGSGLRGARRPLALLVATLHVAGGFGVELLEYPTGGPGGGGRSAAAQTSTYSLEQLPALIL